MVRLQKFFERLPHQGLYVAKKGLYLRDNKYHGLVFGSGAGFGLSRDIVDKLVVDMDSIIEDQVENHGILMDDMQFGNQIINRYGIPLTEGQRQYVNRYDLENGNFNPGEFDYHYYFTGYKDYRSHLLLHQMIMNQQGNGQKTS